MKPITNDNSRTGPQFEGPIGNPKAGFQARYSFLGADGKRHYHRTEVLNNFTEQESKALLGK